jgi:Xaa-Pro aminopeptidase
MRESVEAITCDRSLPEIYAHYLRERGVEVVCDPELGVLERRGKSQREIDALEAAQKKTEQAVEFACRMIARADCGKDGVLTRDGEPLTSERVQAEINIFLLRNGMGTSTSIVAGGDHAADCHERGKGALRTGQTVIVDVFPMDPSTRYFGDCSRTVVHGEAPAEVARAHAAVVEAKDAGIAFAKTGATGDGLHEAVVGVLEKHGYSAESPKDGSLPTRPTMVHGTGHGVGLDVHEPPLLATGGPELVRGDCLTIEPGLYAKGFGGIRVEDMVIVTDDGCINLNSIPTGLDWT